MQKNFDFKSNVVVSGISGRFPQSENLDEFWQNLIDGKDMVSDGHNRYSDLGLVIPGRLGTLKSLDKFDADFFSVHGKQSNVLDPRLRKLLEVSYEAIFDAGIHPAVLQGSNTGVFVAVSDSEASAIWKRGGSKANVYGVLGNAVSMMANRLSFTFGFHGPSYVVDTACSSASVALQQALHSIRTGLCDAAIVAGAHCHHDPVTSYMFHHLEMTSKDGKCKVFDAAADGYARAEAAVAIYICKKQVAKRSYATLVHAAINNDGYKEQGITFPSDILQERVIRKVYEDINLDPHEVDYIEAHGTGTKVGDPEEMAAITRVFCEGRKGTLLVGSVKSNMGHPEPVAGLCSIAKVLLSHVAGIVPANLHYSVPNADIPALHDGRIEVVDKNQPFNAKYVGLNSMGFGGTNVHILLKLEDQGPEEQWNPSTPLLLLGSGRTDEAVKCYLDKALKNQKRQHFVKLLHELSKDNVPKHPFRGYVLASSSEHDGIVVEECEPKDSIWFIFTGMGSQWAGMSKDLVRFATFKNSVRKSAEYLMDNGFDLMGLLESGKTELFDNLKNAMVAITSVQVALVDLLASVGIRPDGIIGHSTGEVAAGYADRCLSQKETILASLARARAFLESNLPPGTVISVGLTWEEALKRCPKGAYPAIHNAKENVTVAGPPDVLQAFFEELESEGIFAKQIRSSSYGFHSPLVHDSAVLARELLGKVILEPKLRSKKWLSSSVPEHLWDSDQVKYCSAEYYVSNGINPVFFYPTLLHVPESALVLELAPHCFMLSILKQSVPKTCEPIGLIHVKAADNCLYFLNALGKCYLNGINFDVAALYDPVQFPVSSRAPNISSMIRWDYSESWYVPHNNHELNKQKGMRYSINMQLPAEAFFEGHSLDGRCVFPATGYLWLVWRFFSSEHGSNVDNFPVVFENIRFERITLLSKAKETEFLVNIFHGSGKFEITESDMIVCTGDIRVVEGSLENEMLNCEKFDDIDTSGPYMVKEDFYQEMHLRGYGHSGRFQGIKEVSMDGGWAKVEWPGHWVSFLDSVLQTYVLRNESRELFVPTRLKKMTIDPLAIKAHLNGNDNVIKVHAWQAYRVGTCPGLELRGLSFAKFHQKALELRPTTTEQLFVLYLGSKDPVGSELKALEFCTEIAVENSFGPKFVFAEILKSPESMISDLVIKQCMFAFTAFEFRTVSESSGTIDEERLNQSGSRIISLKDLQSSEQCHLVFADDVDRVSDAQASVLPGGFVLLKGSPLDDASDAELALISQKLFSSENKECCFSLFRKLCPIPTKISYISMDDPNFDWVARTNEAMKTLAEHDRLIFTATLPCSGIIGFIKCLVKEVTPEKIRCYQVTEGVELDFAEPSQPLSEQFRKDLVYNVFKNECWGYFGNVVIPHEDFDKQTLCSHVYANALRMGELSSLSWIESRLAHSKKDLVDVHYSSLNFKDIMLATGRLVQDATPGSSSLDDCVLGLEFAGKYQGKRVYGMGSSQCLATHIDPSKLIIMDIPEDWTYQEAATVPAVYFTVYLALVLRGRIQPGESILIHAGSGGVGQAAIAVALSYNCKVFTTVSSQTKRDFLKTRFPSLTDESFANSRDSSDFLRHIMKQTNGKGVDLVLNSLAQEKLKASIDCLGENGRFLEIGKFDLFNDTNIGLSVFLKGAGFYGILADQLIEKGPSTDLQTLRNLIHDGIASGVIRPLNSTVFGHDQLEDAFRFMAQGKHIGKVLIRIKESEDIHSGVPAYPRTYFHPSKSYIIVGGLGGMGFELANWMVQRGAKYLVLVSRSGVKSTYHEYQIRVWEKRGVKVILSKYDASTIEGARNLVAEARKIGPIGGIFNTAVLLKDALFEDQTSETFLESAKCKANATMNLDVLSRQLAPELDHFVVFSSIAAGRGNPGQTNYGYSNSVMERICEQRKALGFPALALQWGAVADVGVLYRQIGDRKTFAGLIPQRLKSCLETLDTYLQQGKPVVSSFLAVQKGDLTTFDAKDSLVDIAARILGIKDVSKVNPKTTLVDLGMDSLMGAELSQVLSSRPHIQIPAKMYPQLTFEKLAELERGEKSEDDAVPESPIHDLQKILEWRKAGKGTVFKMNSLATIKDDIFIVHPLDGTMLSLETLVASMDANVYGIDCVREAPLDSIEALAKFYLQSIRKIQPRGPYKIIGFSFGCHVAFEIALLLEKEKEVVSRLVLLDGSPRWRGILQNLHGGEKREQEWETAVLASLLQHYLPDVSMSVYKQIAEVKTFDDKWTYLAKVLSESRPELNSDEIKDLMMGFMGRAKCAAEYDPSKKVKAKTVLVKALQTGVDRGIAYDYSLSEICENAVEVIGVQGNHYCFCDKPLELGIPEILNNLLIG